MRGILAGILFAACSVGGPALAQTSDAETCAKITRGERDGLAACNRVIKSNASAEDKSNAHFSLGLYYTQTARNDEAGFDHYMKALTFNSKNVGALLNSGNIRGRRRDYKGAIDTANKALELGVSAYGRQVALCMRGTSHLRLGDHEQAFKDFQGAIDAYKSGACLVTRARAYEDRKLIGLAVADYKEILTIEAKNDRDRANLNRAIERLNELRPGQAHIPMPKVSAPVVRKKDVPAPVAKFESEPPLTADSILPRRRVALIIANSRYRHAEALKNPINDAARLEASLQRIGFASVTKHVDLDLAGMTAALRAFSREASQSDLAMLFFAGHGIEVDGQNYLIPVDASLERASDAELEAISLRSVMSQVETARVLSLVVLDACRNNPFGQRMIRQSGRRSVGRGLAAVEPNQNMLVAYAAKEGTTAEDGLGASSPFTLSLAQHIETANLDVRILFGRVRDDVIKATGKLQQPHLYGSLGGTSIFLSGTAR